MFKVGDKFIARPKTDMHKVPPGSICTIKELGHDGFYSVKWAHDDALYNSSYTKEDFTRNYTQIKKKLIILIED